ncbi:hypothetical protein TCSYLVIO_010183, partial [Trypanosoma cruzi]
QFHSGDSRLVAFFPSVSAFKKWRRQQQWQYIRHVTGEQSRAPTQSAGHERTQKEQHGKQLHTEKSNNSTEHGGSQHTRTERERDMHAKFNHSATPFKVLPKQSASDTVIGHTLPVDRRGNDADTKGITCTNVGGTNSQHSHTTLALSVHPTSRLKRPRQKSINKIMKREKQLPCRHFRAPQQRHQQQERASLCLQQCTFLCSWPLGALNTTRPSRAQKASITQVPFTFSTNGVAAMNHV